MLVAAGAGGAWVKVFVALGRITCGTGVFTWMGVLVGMNGTYMTCPGRITVLLPMQFTFCKSSTLTP